MTTEKTKHRRGDERENAPTAAVRQDRFCFVLFIISEEENKFFSHNNSS